MAFTQLYLHNAAAPYTPATLRGAWDDTAGAVTKRLSPSKVQGGVIASVARAETSTTDEYDVLLYRGVSGPLAAQTISGNLDCVIGVRESSTNQNAHWHVHVYVTQGDSDTPRGTLLSDYREAAGTNEWPSTAAGKALNAATALSALAVSAGDRLVVEIGYASRNTSATSYTGSLWYGSVLSDGTPAADLAAAGDETSLAGFLTFSSAIAEAADTATVSQVVAESLTSDAAPSALVTQLVVETLSPLAVAIEALITQLVVESLTTQSATAIITQLVVETISRSPLYDCPGASPGPSLCGPETVLTWIEQTQQLVGSPDSTTRVVSDIALPDPSTYYHGKKEPRVLEFGGITRRLSDVQGQWQGATMTWREAETDRALRGRLAVAATRAVQNCDVVCRMIRESEWIAKSDARTMFIGHVLRVSPYGEDLSTEIEAGDELARAIDAEEATCPKRLLSPLYLPGLPVEQIGVPEPILYGQFSGALSSATPPVLTGDPSRGAFVDGGVQVFGYGDLADPPGAPSNVTLTEVAGAGSIDLGEGPSGGETYYAFVTSVDVDGNESDPDAFAQRDSGSVASVTLAIGGSPGSAIQVTWDAPLGGPGPVAYRVYLGWDYYGVRVVQRIEVAAGSPLEATFDDCPTWTEWTLDDYSQLASGAVRSPYTFFADWAVSAVVAGEETALSAVGVAKCEGYRRPIHVEWFEVAGATEYRVYRRAGPGAPYDRRWSVVVAGSPPVGSPPIYSFDDDLLDTGVTYISDAPQPRGLVPVIYTGQETLTSTGETWYRFLVAGHAIAGIDEWYFDGVLEAPGTAGVDYLIPGYPGWTDRFGAPTYRDFNGRRYTVIYARGAKGDALAGYSGSPVTLGAPASTLTLNLRGIEGSALADGSGGLITDVHEQFLHWFINFGPLGDYQTDGWLPAPTWSPLADHCKIDTDSFRTAAAQAEALLTGGYVGAGRLAESAALRDWIARWCQSCDVRIGINASGQWMVARHVPDPATPIARTYTDVRHVQAGSVVIEQLDEEHWNAIPYQYRYDPAAGAWEVTGATLVDVASVAAYGQTRIGPAHDLYFIRADAVAADILTRVLARHADPPLRIAWQTIDLCGTLTELGEVIGLSHLAGTDVDAWSSLHCFVEGVVVDPQQHRTGIETRALVAPHLET